MTPTSHGLPAGIQHPFTPAGLVDPHPAYRWLRADRPVWLDPLSRMWLVTDHAGCAAVLRRAEFSAAQGQRGRARADAQPASMLTTDPPEHHRLRAPGGRLLGPAAVRSIMGPLAVAVGCLVAGLPAELDASAGLGEPLATAALACLLGLPGAELAHFADLARAASVNLDPLGGPEQARTGQAAIDALGAYLGAHADRVAGGGAGADSPLAALLADGRVSRAEQVGILNLAVVGGWAPLAETVGNALPRLLSSPQWTERLAAGPEFARTAVDEVLRLDGPIPLVARVATAPVQLGGVTLPAGAPVLALLAAANRDPAVFDRADEFVPDRSPNPHLAFGAGGHFCLGATFVREAGAALLTTLFAQRRLRPVGLPPRWAPVLIPHRRTGQRLAVAPAEPGAVADAG